MEDKTEQAITTFQCRLDELKKITKQAIRSNSALDRKEMRKINNMSKKIQELATTLKNKVKDSEDSSSSDDESSSSKSNHDEECECSFCDECSCQEESDSESR